MPQSHKLDHGRFLVEPGKKLRLKDHDPAYTGAFKDKAEAQSALLEDVSGLAAEQDRLWASKAASVIVILQALDAAGKDSTIKHVMSGVNPRGVDVHSFGPPNDLERLHHFLWRPAQLLPALGRLAIFNRSYYEEVLVVRVHPEWLDKQWLPRALREDLPRLWKTRYAEINDWEHVCHEQGVMIIKFFLNVSKEKQRKRLLERLDDPHKQWKFNPQDVDERAYWDDYMQAYEEMLAATSTEQAPWHVIPADKKWFTRACVADIITARVAQLDLKFPELDKQQLAELATARARLETEAGD
jgi:PPK2 family polyphosphate:nucleotide phosphotransferase